MTVGKYLTNRLEELKLGHIFGIPGDYVLRFFDHLVASKMQVVATCDEQGAGFAADAYARVNGVGALCVTYCVGGLKTVNAVAGAYAEKAPLIVISGSPGIGEREKSHLLHHKVKDYTTQLEVYQKITVAAEAIESPEDAPKQIDRALLACIHHKRPVYIELPRDIVDEPCEPPEGRLEPHRFRGNRNALREAIAETAAMIGKAKRPVILGGVEIHRFGLQEDLLELVESAGLPIAATLLGKSIISERHPQYLGVYEGAMGRENVRSLVESADCVLVLGAFMTDINLGIYTANLDVNKTILATSEDMSVKNHHYHDVNLKEFIRGLTKAEIGGKRKINVPRHRPAPSLKVKMRSSVTVKRFFERMNEFLDESMMVIADIGDSLFGAADLTIAGRTEFISPAYYTSMGYAVPAALGAQIANPERRPLVFVGDGAFQMTGQELSSIARYGLNPIVFVLNNKGFTTERFIHEGPYNDVHEWAYHLMPTLLRSGWGMEVRNEGELEEALSHALTNTNSFSIINVHLDKMDRSKALERLGSRLAKRVEVAKKQRASARRAATRAVKASEPTKPSRQPKKTTNKSKKKAVGKKPASKSATSSSRKKTGKKKAGGAKKSKRRR